MLQKVLVSNILFRRSCLVNVICIFQFLIASGANTIGIREFVFVPFLQTVIIFYSVEFLLAPDPEEEIEDLDNFFMEGFPRIIFINIVLFYLHQLTVDIWFAVELMFWISVVLIRTCYRYFPRSLLQSAQMSNFCNRNTIKVVWI